jgi:NitT/TauT family transport system substrate-binding protein
MFTTDARMPAGGPETVLKVLAAYKPQVKSKNIDLSKTYTNAYLDAAAK